MLCEEPDDSRAVLHANGPLYVPRPLQTLLVVAQNERTLGPVLADVYFCVENALYSEVLFFDIQGVPRKVRLLPRLYRLRVLFPALLVKLNLDVGEVLDDEGGAPVVLVEDYVGGGLDLLDLL